MSKDTKLKKYVCECGKEFSNPQSFNGHKSSCKVHLIAVGKPITVSSLYNPASQAKAHATKSKKCAEKREQLNQQWAAEQHTCERCGKVMLEKFGSGRFCSRACANARDHSIETRKKLAKAASKRISATSANVRVATVAKTPVNLLDISKRTISKIVLRMKLPCSCCGIYVPGVVWDIHHIIPRKSGGSDAADNLTYICPNCHRICHTDATLLPNKLISLEDFFKLKGKRWQDYYFVKTTQQ